ncbi:c-type cytochrome [Thermus islandicus]|uniref:c-type cytochrome n=1 Tax=Thermus islandicus TaxID=540988 RepID=UPI0003B6174B|nr:cytochrome c [Thermus islandicus]
MGKRAYAWALLALGLAWGQSGQGLYSQYCSGCHQPSGQGLPGAFPPLAGHVQEILAKPGGRTYLMDVLLFGLQGSIQVKGQTYNGQMSAWGPQLKDGEIAAILNYISTNLGNKPPKGFKAYTAAEIAKERAKKLTPDKVYALRKSLKL